MPDPAADPTSTASIVALQRTAGNHAVTRMLAASPLQRNTAAAPPAGGEAAHDPALTISPETEKEMRADVDFIVEKLSQELLTAAGEAEIVARLEHWDHRDFDLLIARGAPGTPHLDKILFLLKTRTFTRRTASSFWIEQYANAFDELWRELEDDRLTTFEGIVKRSQKQAQMGPTGGPTENFWKTMGKQEAMGLMGTMKGIVEGAGGLVDAGSGGLTALVNAALKPTGVQLDKPFQVSEWLGKQYDYMGRRPSRRSRPVRPSGRSA